MSNPKQLEPTQDKAMGEEALAPMRTLTTEELVEVFGGPEIQNGGGVSIIVTTSGTGG